MVQERKRCPSCGKPEGYLLETHADQPGFFGLLRGEGDDPSLNCVAWLALFVIVFAIAVGVFALIS